MGQKRFKDYLEDRGQCLRGQPGEVGNRWMGQVRWKSGSKEACGKKGVRALWRGTGPLSASQLWPRRSLITCLTSCFQFSRQTGNPDFYIQLSKFNCWQLILFCFWKAMGRLNKRCLKGKSIYNMFSKQTQVNFIWWISQSSPCMWNFKHNPFL